MGWKLCIVVGNFFTEVFMSYNAFTKDLIYAILYAIYIGEVLPILVVTQHR